MADSRQPGPIGKTSTSGTHVDPSARRRASSPGPVGRDEKTAGTRDILRRIRKWRDFAEFTGLFPDAVKALDHFLSAQGTFVEIPTQKVKSLRASSEQGHLQKSREAFQRAAIMEAAATWLDAKGFPVNGGKLVPSKIEFVLTWQSGTVSRGVTNDNLTYFGSSIHSEVRFLAEQMTIPANRSEETFEIRISVVQWKSWVVDNYDWEGDKEFGIFPALGLPTQKEMNSLHTAGLAKSYQRSSRSWIVKDHALTAWTETPYSLDTWQEGGRSRRQTNLANDRKRQKEQAGGALPTPHPAEEMIQ